MHPVNVVIISIGGLMTRNLSVVMLAEAFNCSKCFLGSIAVAKTSELDPTLNLTLHCHVGTMGTII